jgi:hypothetical protein
LERTEAEAGGGGDEIGLLAAGLVCILVAAAAVVVHEMTPVVDGIALAIGTGAAEVVIPGVSATQPK